MLNLKSISLPRTHFTCHADVHIPQGQRVVLMGPSGSGKSSFLKTIAGFETPSRGSIWIEGQEITKLPPAERPVTILFQNHNLFPHLTVFENTCLGLKPSLKINATERSKVMDALEEMEIDHLAPKRPAEISGGEIQRTALARSLLRPHKILLLDEPFTGLGPRMCLDLINIMKRIQEERGLTFLLSTHQSKEAHSFGERLLFIEEGNIIVDSLLPEALNSQKVSNYLAKN